MARNNTNRKEPNVLDNQPFEGRFKQPDKLQFINVSLNDTDQQWLRDNMGDFAFHITELLTAANDGLLRITLTPDAKSGRWNAILTCCDTSSTRFGKALSCRAKSASLALYALAYADGHKVESWAVAANSDSDLFG